MDFTKHLKPINSNAGVTGRTMLKRPVSDLVDVDEKASKTLVQLGIHTIFDLATSPIFISANNLVAEDGAYTRFLEKGEALNATDTVIQELPEGERAQFILASGQQEDNIPVFNFNLTLKKVATSKERLAAIDACTGKYEMSLPLRPPNEEVVIHREAQRLFLDLPGYATVELKPQGQDDFLATSVNCRLVFNRNEDGSVNSVTIHSILKSDKKAPVVAPKTA